MTTPEEAAQNECMHAEVAELVKRYVSSSRLQEAPGLNFGFSINTKEEKN